LVLIMGLAGEGITQSKTNSLSGIIIAGLGERTANAELELARIQRPRIIKPRQANDLVVSLRKYPGSKKFWIIVDKSEIDTGTEQEMLGDRLRGIFAQALWTPDAHTLKDRTKLDPSNMPNLNIGCLVSAEQTDLANFVAEELKIAGIACDTSAPHPEMAIGLVMIEIGL
ncbi:MAG: hypothetical protein ABSF41_09955, partial [Pseudolabrys sp.]